MPLHLSFWVKGHYGYLGGLGAGHCAAHELIAVICVSDEGLRVLCVVYSSHSGNFTEHALLECIS